MPCSLLDRDNFCTDAVDKVDIDSDTLSVADATTLPTFRTLSLAGWGTGDVGSLRIMAAVPLLVGSTELVLARLLSLFVQGLSVTSLLLMLLGWLLLEPTCPRPSLVRIVLYSTDLKLGLSQQ